MTKLRLVQHNADHDVLLKAAGQLFRQHGFAATTVRDIAKTAGVLPGSLHYRYATKEALLLALMERGITTATTAVRHAISATPNPIDRIRIGVRAHLHLLLLEDDSIYVLLYESRSLTDAASDSMARLRDRYDALWDGLLYEAAGTGKLRDDIDLKLVRLALFGSLNWVAQWYSPDGELTPDEIADAFADNMLRGILVAPAVTRPSTDEES